MVKMTKLEFAEILAGLHEVFTPEKKLSEERIEIYWRIFGTWDIEHFRRACNNVVAQKTISTFPLPGEIIVAGNDDRALQAWITARRAISVCTNTASVIFVDPIIHSVIEAMEGWPAFCWITDEDLPFRQRDFERLYKMYSSASRHPLYVQGNYDSAHNMIDLRSGQVKRLKYEETLKYLESQAEKTPKKLGI
jgi:hypothetical protein